MSSIIASPLYGCDGDFPDESPLVLRLQKRSKTDTGISSAIAASLDQVFLWNKFMLHLLQCVVRLKAQNIHNMLYKLLERI